MNNSEILANAPKGATHVGNNLYYYKLADVLMAGTSIPKSIWKVHVGGDVFATCNNEPVRSLSDIRRIVELEEMLEHAMPIK